MNTFAKIFVSIILSAIIGVIAMVISYQLAILISPPYVMDELTGEKHGLMPMGQVFLSVLIAFVIFVFSFIIFYRKLIRQKNN